MPHTPEIDAVHPLGKIPALRHGDVTLAESRAICFYIDHAFGGPPYGAGQREGCAAATLPGPLVLGNRGMSREIGQCATCS
jgi:glutathione S-transferase